MTALMRLAEIAMGHAYAPYSHFKVGCAIMAANGEIYTGSNVENASYGLTLCAERVALAQAISHGERKFVKMAIFADGDTLPMPCGACLQVLREFMDDMPIEVACSGLNGFRLLNLKDLLPSPFALKEEA